MFDAYTQYAGFWRRLGATVLDGLIYAPISWGIFYLAYGPAVFSADWVSGPRPLDLIVDYLLPALITLWMWQRFFATPGKMLMGCRVVDADSGEALSRRQSLLRYLGYIVSLLPLGLGFLWIAWDRRKQGFHDRIANSVVVMEDVATEPLAQLLSEAGQ